ncbi:MAG: ABC transporter permease [Candidatus Kariarchaeaceae archaeon]|jgi:ABC-type antimicrobial peptide transport system permease subunit
MIRERLEWIPLTTYAIFRNKRRSFAMISGIVLGIMILSGIFLYSTVLEQQNFETIVNNAPYEITLNLRTDETRESLLDLADLIQSDPEVLDYTILAAGTEDFGAEVIIDKAGFGESDPNRGEEDIFGFGMTPIFVDADFHETEIGKKTVKTNFEGDFSEISAGNTTIIPRSVASKYQLRVGDIIKKVNITYSQYFWVDDFDNEVYRGSLSNVEVVGIYEIDTGDAGLFTGLLETHDIFFSSTLLNSTLPEIDNIVARDQGFFLAVKIDEKEFKISDPEEMNNGINKYINQIVKEAENLQTAKYPYGMGVYGKNEIEELLIPFQIFNIFITIFDILLVLPAVILSLYLLFFGVEMALEERRREIAIKKVQGANTRQLFGEMRNEAFLLFIFGTAIGYLGGIFGAWIIASSLGFLKFDVGSFNDFQDFFQIDTSTILWSAGIVGLILVIQVYRKGKSFIVSEVSEGVQRYEEKKHGFLRRNNLDIVLFAIGSIGIVLGLLDKLNLYQADLSFLLSFVIYGLGPFFFWIGGSIIGARLSKKIPLKLESTFLSLAVFKDVSRIIRSGLRRRGDTDRLAIIIVLTLSIATLAAAQGTTDEQHAIRTIEWEVGSDFQVNFALPSDYTHNLTSIQINGENVVNQALGLGFGPTVTILNDAFSIVGFNATEEYENINSGKSTGIWHSDSFPGSNKRALKKLSDNPIGVYLGSDALGTLDEKVGNEIKLNVQVGDKDFSSIRVKILGKVSHIPGNIGGGTIITNSALIQKLRALAGNKSIDAYDNLPMNASRWLVKTNKGMKMSSNDINLFREELQQIQYYSSDISLKKELDNLKSGSGAFGIPGLLSLDFIVSVSAALISTFAFVSILMERRRYEFAVLRAIGAKKLQIYKLAIGESTLMILTAVIWGIIIGAGITYIFNGVFVVFSIFLGGGFLDRQIVFPWISVILIGLGMTLGMLLATLLSVRGAARQDLSMATRVV